MSDSPSRQRKQKAIRHHRKLKNRRTTKKFHGSWHCPHCGRPIWGTRISFEHHKGNCADGRKRKVRM